MVSKAEKMAQQAALQHLRKRQADKAAKNSKCAKFDGQLTQQQTRSVATGTKRERENDEERKVQPSGKRLKITGSQVLQDKSTNTWINRPSRQVVNKPKSQVQPEYKGSKQGYLPPRQQGIIRPQARDQSGLQTAKRTGSQDGCREKGANQVRRWTAPRNASWVRDMCRGPPRASAQAPKPTFKVLQAITPTPDSAFPTAENGSKAIVESNEKSPAKSIKAIKVIDAGSGLAPKTVKDDNIHGLSQGKKRLADTDLESHDRKRTKQISDPSSNRKQSGGNGKEDGNLMSKVTPEAPSPKRGAEEDLEGKQRKRQKTASELGRDGLSAAQVAQDRKVRQRAAGLRNASNTCYYNAVLETLVQTEPVREFCLARADDIASTVGSDVVVGKHTTRQNAQTQAQVADLCVNVDPDDVNMGAHMGKLFNSMYFEPQVEGEEVISPYVCSQAYGRIHPGFDGHQQQDSAQFLTDVLMRLVQEDRAANQLAPNEKSVVESAFEGEECRTLVCTGCQKISLRDGKFRLLGLSLPQQTSRTQEARTLTECLDKYVEEVRLAGYKCEHCNQLDQTRSSTRMKSAPQYLAMQVLRMACDETTSWRPRKLMDTVVFPETVDLAPWTTGSEPQVYELYSVIEHIGSSTDSGHYVACVQQKDGQWTHYNDDNVQGFEISQILKINPYLLFYRRKESRS